MRDNSISIAKAISILLMVLAHTCFSQYANYWINMFHMPLFFFFAGYCFKDKYLDLPKVFLNKRIGGLYKPFVKWSVLFLLMHNIFFHLNIYNGVYGFRGSVSHLYEWKEVVVGIVHVITRMTDNEQLLGGYWFLKSLFLGSLIGYITIKYIKNKYYGGAILLCITIVLALTNKSFPYFGIGARDFFSADFFFVGYSYKKAACVIHKRMLIVPIGVVLVTFGEYFYQASLLHFLWWQVVPYAITAIAGTLAIFYLSNRIAITNIKVCGWLTYIGNNTLTILTWHMLCFKVVSLMIIGLYNLPIERLAEFPVIEYYSKQGWFILYFIIGTSVPLLMTKSKYFK